MRVAKDVIHIIYCIVLPRKNESLAVDASNHIIFECYFFLLKFLLKVWTLNDNFEKSIAVKTPRGLCSGLQIEVIFE